jgi:hypothetical protein
MTTAAAIIHISQRLHLLRSVCLEGESIPYELVFIDQVIQIANIEPLQQILNSVTSICKDMAVEEFKEELLGFLK